MAEEKKVEQTWEEPVLILFIIAFILHSVTLSAPANYIENTFGIEATFLESNRPLTSDTPIGTHVITVREGTIMSEPGGGRGIAIAPKDSIAIVRDGPVLINGTLWWQLEYEDGTIGWVSGDTINVETKVDRRALKASTPHGTKVVTKKDTELKSDPAGGNTGTVSASENGTIVGGPVSADGTQWWLVRFEDGTSGWVSEDDIEIDVPRDIRGVNDTTPLNTAVRTIGAVGVFAFPQGAQAIGSQAADTYGTLLHGPVTFGTERRWDIDFESGPDGWVPESSIERRFAFSEAFRGVRHVFTWFAYILSFLFFIGVMYVFFKMRDMTTLERRAYKAMAEPLSREKESLRSWNRVLDHVSSSNPSDWRLAVIEADIMLDEMVKSLLLPGESLGERLQNAEKSNFLTLDKAWEAHKMRNQIAHEGGDFILTQREAKRVIDLYKEVFDEFHFI